MTGRLSPKCGVHVIWDLLRRPPIFPVFGSVLISSFFLSTLTRKLLPFCLILTEKLALVVLSSGAIVETYNKRLWD